MKECEKKTRGSLLESTHAVWYSRKQKRYKTGGIEPRQRRRRRRGLFRGGHLTAHGGRAPARQYRVGLTSRRPQCVDQPGFWHLMHQILRHRMIREPSRYSKTPPTRRQCRATARCFFLSVTTGEELFLLFLLLNPPPPPPLLPLAVQS